MQDGVIVSIKVTNLVTSQLLRLRIAISIGLPAGAGNTATMKGIGRPRSLRNSRRLVRLHRIFYRCSRTKREKLILFYRSALLSQGGKTCRAFVGTGPIIMVLFSAASALTVPSMNRRESQDRCRPHAPGPKRRFCAMPGAAFRNADTRHK